MLITYKKYNPSAKSKVIIELCNEIIDEYTNDGFILTLRQLYYQLVARDHIANKQSEYNRLGGIVNKGRLGGLIDWEAIEDRTRFIRELSHWSNPSHIIRDCASQFKIDFWENQSFRPEVWIEKDALIGVIEPVCEKYDVPYFSCRGYVSQSEMWNAAQRVQTYIDEGQQPYIIHLGDHDPSGKDMTRDIEDRFNMFTHYSGVEVKRIALNWDQIEEYNPPPNPAKMTDSRFETYQAEFGDDSWELDALEPKVISKLIEDILLDLISQKKWNKSIKEQKKGRNQIQKIADNI